MAIVVSPLTRQAVCTVSVKRSGTDELLRRFVLASGARASDNTQRSLGVCPVSSTKDKEVVPVDLEGIVPVEAGAAVALDTDGTKPLTTDAQGRAVVATGGAVVRAWALSAASAVGDIISARLVQ